MGLRYLFGPVAPAFADEHLGQLRQARECVAFDPSGATGLAIGLTVLHRPEHDDMRDMRIGRPIGAQSPWSLSVRSRGRLSRSGGVVNHRRPYEPFPVRSQANAGICALQQEIWLIWTCACSALA